MTKRFLADAHIARSTVQLLQSLGHDIVTVQERLGEGADDKEIAELARQEGRTILTTDKGFGDVRHYPPSQYHGIIVIRVQPLSTRRINKTLKRFLANWAGADWTGTLFVLSNKGVRIRR